MRFPTDCDIMSRCCWNQNTRLTARVDGSSTSQMCCVQLAAHKKQVPPTVVMWLFYNAAHCFRFLEMFLHLAAPHAWYHQTQHSTCAGGGGFFMLPTDEPPCCDKGLKKTHAPFTKWAATQKRAATGDFSSTSRKTVLVLMASGVHFTTYFIFSLFKCSQSRLF